MITAKDIEKLNEWETFHLLEAVIGFDQVEERMQEVLENQQTMETEDEPCCQTCQGIAQKLGLSKEETQ